MIFLVQFGILKYALANFSKATKCTRPTGLLLVFEKLTRGYLCKIALEIM